MGGSAERFAGHALAKAGQLWIAARDGLTPTAPATEEVPTPLRSLEEVETDLRATLEEFEVDGQFEVTSQATFTDKAGSLFDLTAEFIRRRSDSSDRPVLKRTGVKEAVVLPEDDADTISDDLDLTLKEVPKPVREFYVTVEAAGRVVIKNEDSTPTLKMGSQVLIPASSIGYIFVISRNTAGSRILYGSMREFEKEDGKQVSNTKYELGGLSSKDAVQTYASCFIQAVTDLLTEFGTPPFDEATPKPVTSGS